MALTDNIVAYWKLEETSGTRYDETANNNDLTDNNTVGYESGVILNAAKFIATNSESLSISDASQTGLDLSGSFTFAFWCKAENNVDLAIQKRSSSSDQAYYFERYTDNKFYLSVVDSLGAESYKITSSTVDLTAYSFIVITFNATVPTMSIYKNTVAVAGTWTSLGGFSGTLKNTTAPFEIGRFATRYSTGSIDELGIWSRVLSTDEITSLYNGGAGLTYPFTTTSTVTPAGTLSLLGCGM